MNRENSHPGISEYFDSGALSVRRTEKNYSRTAHDITLEQTVNRDAASRHTGIAAFTNSVSARKRWCITRAERSKVITLLCQKAGIEVRDSVAQELKSTQIKHDNEDRSKLINTIREMRNPFDPELRDDSLYCLTTGAALADDIANELISSYEKGKEWMGHFIMECKNRPERFEEPIKSQKIRNFASDGLRVPMKSKEVKICE